ncbi:MAG TPA: hypothetical protein VHM65_09535 [Candidatus Lustribacter sp.]|nr:hypothetical protein [Candidatus Lustribacter sp.]
MPIPYVVTAFTHHLLNPLVLRAAGRLSVGDLEHVGRSSGRVFHTPIMAFRESDVVTIALTYGTDVDWYRNLRAAGGGRLRLGGSLLRLGPPRPIGVDSAMARIPHPQKAILPIIRCRDFIELRVLGETPVDRGAA